MTAVLRRATAGDAAAVAALVTELGYPATAADVHDRIDHSLRSKKSCLLVAEAAGEVIGLVSAELVPYFPNGSTVCRLTTLVVSSRHRGRGVGAMLLAGAAEFAREHRCWGIELTSAMHRVDAHRFYERAGFSRHSYRFFKTL